MRDIDSVYYNKLWENFRYIFAPVYLHFRCRNNWCRNKWVVLCSTSLDAWLHACLRLSSPNAENIFEMATAIELVKWLARLTSTQTTRVRFPMVEQEKKIYFLAAFQCFGGHCKPSGQSAQSLSSPCFLELIYRLKIKITFTFTFISS